MFLYNFQFKNALRSLFKPSFWKKYKVEPSKDKGVFETYKLDLEGLLHSIPLEYRRIYVEYLEKRTVQFVRDIAFKTNEKEAMAAKYRLFQLVQEKQSIEKTIEKDLTAKKDS